MTERPRCPDYPDCADRRTLDAQHRGEVLAKLAGIDNNIHALWEEMKTHRADIKSLYFKIGFISGGTSLVVSLIVSMVMK